MAFTEIVYCPGDDLSVVTAADGKLEFFCSGFPAFDPGHSPQTVTIEEYCGIEDCRAVQDASLNQETFEAFWPWALLMIAVAFSVRTIRRAIYAKA